ASFSVYTLSLHDALPICSGEVLAGLKSAESPTYEVGSKVIIETDHMKGMKGAEATIVGAFSTNAYAVSYTPTTGGEKVKNHKWRSEEHTSELQSRFDLVC